MIPLPLWVPSARDLAGFYPTPFFRAVQTTANAVIVTTFIDIPEDQVLLLSFWSVSADAGATQSRLRMEGRIQDAQNAAIFSIMRRERDGRGDVNGEPAVWLPPLSRVVGEGEFSGAVNPNIVGLSVGGYLIPRGNISRL